MRFQEAPAGHRTLDVRDLPDQGAFGPSGLIWWGTTGYMVIEGSMFVMVLIVYFYLRLRVEEWPPSLPNPDLFYGTLNLLVLLISIWPNHLAKVAAERFDGAGARRWLVASAVVGFILVIIRGLEFTTLNCRWDDSAYGAITWGLLILHTTHLLTDVGDTSVLTVLALRQPLTKRRFVDISENGLYWYFIVAWWFPVYLVIYFAPRWL